MFKVLIELMIPGIEEATVDETSHILYYGTNDKISPSFVSIFGLINKPATVISKIKKAIGKLDATIEEGIIDWTLTNDEIILAPTNYKLEAEAVPNDMDVITSISKDVAVNKETSVIASIINKPQASLTTIINPQTVGIGNGFLEIKKPVLGTQETVVETELSPIEKILGRKNNAADTSDVFNPFGIKQPVNNGIGSVSGSDILMSNLLQQSSGIGGISSGISSGIGGYSQGINYNLVGIRI